MGKKQNVRRMILLILQVVKGDNLFLKLREKNEKYNYRS